MKVVDADSGRSFDPAVVDVLKRRYVELEKMAVASCVGTMKLSEKDIKIERGEAPAAGFESSGRHSIAPGSSDASGGSKNPLAQPEEQIDFLSAIASARHEVQELFEISQELGNSLSLSETLTLVASRLKRLIPHEAIALYVQKEGKLEAEYVQGENAKLFQSLRIPLGEGLAGWVAQHERAIINGNPAVEPGYLNDPSKFTNLRSALAIPLTGVNGFVGVLALYRSEKDSFRKDHLRILLAIGSKLAVSIENARKFLTAESLSATDELTGLPNLKSMFVRFDAELARSKRVNVGLTILVCDINGFKSINDRLGHLTGNRILKSMADGLREICREYDMVARLGGDEFVIILPEMVTDAVEVKVRQIEQLAARVRRGNRSRRWRTSCSPQVLKEAGYPRDGQTVEELLSEADRRMYPGQTLYAPSDSRPGAPSPSWTYRGPASHRRPSDSPCRAFTVCLKFCWKDCYVAPLTGPPIDPRAIAKLDARAAIRSSTPVTEICPNQHLFQRPPLTSLVFAADMTMKESWKQAEYL